MRRARHGAAGRPVRSGLGRRSLRACQLPARRRRSAPAGRASRARGGGGRRVRRRTAGGGGRAGDHRAGRASRRSRRGRRSCRSRRLAHGPRRLGRAAVHERHRRAAQGCGPAPPAPGVVCVQHGRVRVGRHRRGPHHGRAALPHRLGGRATLSGLLGAPDRAPATVRPGLLDRPGRGRGRNPCNARSHHAGPHRRDPRPPGRSPRVGPLRVLRGRQVAPGRGGEGAGAVPGRGVLARLRPHRDEFDRVRDGSRRPSPLGRLRRSRREGTARIGWPAPAGGGDLGALRRRHRGGGRRSRRDLGEGRAGGRRVRRGRVAARRRRLVPHPRQRAHRRCRLPVGPRTQRRHHRPGRREHVARRDRGRAADPSRRC